MFGNNTIWRKPTIGYNFLKRFQLSRSVFSDENMFQLRKYTVSFGTLFYDDAFKVDNK